MSNKPEKSEFKIGDAVVYPAHGVGKIIDEEKQSIAGVEMSVFVISFDKDKMTLRVPVKRAASSGLRHLYTSSEIDQVWTVLKSRPKAAKGMWSRRAQEYEGKINSGDLTSIAEVVRDLYKNAEDTDRSYSERVIYESAISRLASEISLVCSVDIENASEMIIEQLRLKYAA